MATAIPTSATTAPPRVGFNLPVGLLAYVSVLLLALAATAFAYQGHADFRMVAWRIALCSISNVSCALLGCYLVLRRLSLLGDAISHAVLPGIVVAFLLSGQLGGIWILVGAVGTGLLTAVLTQALSASGQVGEDSSMGIVYTGLFAVGVLLVNFFARQTHIDPDCVLYGMIDNATLVKEIPPGIYRLGAVLITTILALVIFWKELKLVAFDPALATAMGFRVSLVHYGLMALVAVAAVAAFEVVGSILVVAMLIIPAATAALLTDRLLTMVLWAAAIAAGCALLGDLSAAVVNTSIAGMMSVIAGLHLVAAIFLAPRTGLVSRWWRNLQLSLRIVREDILATLYRLEERAGTETTRPRLATWLNPIARGQLVRQGMLAQQSGEWKLTSAGRESARSIVRAHRLWETYLQKHFDLPPDHLHEPAERMEHFLDEQLQAELLAELANETHDPHGRAIPETKAESR